MQVINPKGCNIAETNFGTQEMYANGKERELTENEQQLKTFFADDDFFEKVIAAAPTCSTTNLVVMKIYRMLRVDAEMDEGTLRSKPFLEALIGVLPRNDAFTVKNLQRVIQRSGI